MAQDPQMRRAGQAQRRQPAAGVDDLRMHAGERRDECALPAVAHRAPADQQPLVGRHPEHDAGVALAQRHRLGRQGFAEGAGGAGHEGGVVAAAAQDQVAEVRQFGHDEAVAG